MSDKFKIFITTTMLLSLIISICGIVAIIITLNKPQLKYDLNNDGKVNALDLLILQKYILEKDSE